MVLGILTVLGIEYELFLGIRRKRSSLPSVPPPTIDTTGEAVEETPAASRPALRLVTGRAA